MQPMKLLISLLRRKSVPVDVYGADCPKGQLALFQEIYMKTNLLDFNLSQLTDHFAAMGEKHFGVTPENSCLGILKRQERSLGR